MTATNLAYWHERIKSLDANTNYSGSLPSTPYPSSPFIAPRRSSSPSLEMLSTFSLGSSPMPVHCEGAIGVVDTIALPPVFTFSFPDSTGHSGSGFSPPGSPLSAPSEPSTARPGSGTSSSAGSGGGVLNDATVSMRAAWQASARTRKSFTHRNSWVGGAESLMGSVSVSEVRL